MERLILALPDDGQHIPAGLSAEEARELSRTGLRLKEKARAELVEQTKNKVLNVIREKAGQGHFQTYYEVPSIMDSLAIEDFGKVLKELGYAVTYIHQCSKFSIDWSVRP